MLRRTGLFAALPVVAFVTACAGTIVPDGGGGLLLQVEAPALADQSAPADAAAPDSPPPDGGTFARSLPLEDLFSAEANVTVTVDEAAATATIATNDIPAHQTGQFPALGDSNGDGRPDNPNTIQAQNYVFTIPLEPRLAAQPSDLPMGPIGISVSGAVFYNPYTATGEDAVQSEAFDFCQGHPDQRGSYHYHQYSDCVLNDTPGAHSGVFGIAFDGFYVYGPQDVSGSAPTNLDRCNGHFGPTPDQPEGIYHYHVTQDFPYIIGCYAGVVQSGSAPAPDGGAAFAGGPPASPRRPVGPPPGR